MFDDRSYSARLDGWRVEIIRDGLLVGEARWTGAGIADCTVRLHPDDPEAEAALHRRWVQQIEEEIDAALHGAPPTHDDNGVDLRLIDQMLALTPAERLASLQRFNDDVDWLRRNVRHPIP